MDYQLFLKSKRGREDSFGFPPIFMPDFLFDFQSHLTDWAVRKGRAAIFADCGLGKTPMSLVWAENVIRRENRPVLILTPLAVSRQFVREGEKFGIEVHNARDRGIVKGINVVNYEQLGKFDPGDFAGVVCDECFPPDTLVDIVNPLDNSLERKYIKDIVRGDRIYNASGIDHVKHIWKRQVDRAIQISAGGSRITCSENHLFFTVHGWKSARDLRSGDYLMETDAAMCLVRGDFQAKVCGQQDGEILRNFLLREMADEHSGTQGEGTYEGNTREDWEESFSLVAERRSESKKADGKDSGSESYELSRSSGQNDRRENSQWDVASMEGKTWGERPAFDGTSSGLVGIATEGLDSGIRDFIGEETEGVSDLLQSRHREPEDQNGDRIGWPLPPKQEESRQEKGRKAGFVGVDSVEVLELGHPGLDRYRDEKGDVYFYDVESARHPSFSVNGLIVHNSSILKNFDGKMRRRITDFLLSVNYRLLCTATPAPNDYVELGTSSEALGVMGRNQMLGMFFSHSGDSTQQWELKGYANSAYWKWVATWARAIRRPSDFGYDDGDFLLPPLNVVERIVPSANGHSGYGFFKFANTLNDQRKEKRDTIRERCGEVADNVPDDRPCIVWCHYNAEGDLLEKLIPGSMQVAGSDKDEVKEDRLLGFVDGGFRVLVTKPRIAGFGMNFQHCSDLFCFVSHSYESYYQMVRRCWRFGQKREVNCNLVATEVEKPVMKNMLRKERQASQMFAGIIREMAGYQLDGKKQERTEEVEVPTWL